MVKRVRSWSPGREPDDLVGRVPLLHSGPQELVRVEYRFFGADAAALSLPQEPLVASRVVAPRRTAIRSLPLPRRLQGLTGSHESARAGDGGDFRDVHPFTAGDRLRRIDWKATARRGQNAGDLYVRRTAALADATVLIVLDSRDDVGEQVAEWSRNTAAAKGISALDVAREAASSIAAGYIQAGDRVGFQDLSSRSRMIAHAGGSRHLWRLLRAIEITQPSPVRVPPPAAPDRATRGAGVPAVQPARRRGGPAGAALARQRSPGDRGRRAAGRPVRSDAPATSASLTAS